MSRREKTALLIGLMWMLGLLLACGLGGATATERPKEKAPAVATTGILAPIDTATFTPTAIPVTGVPPGGSLQLAPTRPGLIELEPVPIATPTPALPAVFTETMPLEP